MAEKTITVSEFTNLKLLNALGQIKNFNAFALIMNKISNCNACEAKSFVDAYCESVRPENTVDIFSLSSIYRSGVEILDAFLQTGTEPEQAELHMALKQLLDYAEGSEWQDLATRLHSRQWTEAELSIILLHHCMSKLISSKVRFPVYVVDKYSTKQKEKCPCCSENLTGIFGDTSIGNTEVWHGRVDAVISGTIGLVKFGCPSSEDDSSEPSSSHSDSSAIVELKKDFHGKDIHQILAQTITFSFLQNLMYTEDIPLYPNIGISPKAIQLHYYDSVNDVLLESYEEKLFEDDDLNWVVLIALWMVVNHQVLCSGITQSMKTCKFKAEFLKHEEKIKEIYQRKLSFHCGAGDKKDRLALKKFVAEAKKSKTLKYHKDDSPALKKAKFENEFHGDGDKS